MIRKTLCRNHGVVFLTALLGIAGLLCVIAQTGLSNTITGRKSAEIAPSTIRPACSHDSGQLIVSPFSGSKLIAEYSADFDKLVLATGTGKTKQEITAEGCFSSRIYGKPEDKSNYELYSSYERELKAAGFTIMSQITNPREAYDLAQELYSSRGPNYLRNRGYSFSENINTALLPSADHYLSAKKEASSRTVYVAIVLRKASNVNYKREYLVDVLETSGLEKDTVAISASSIGENIRTTGKAVIYSIYFDVDKAVVLPKSRTALEAMASYLKNNPQMTFYLVGHTDSTGSLSHNMDLSARRANAVTASLTNEHGVNPVQIESIGVGPAAPVSTNSTDAGRSLNRRVELVLKVSN